MKTNYYPCEGTKSRIWGSEKEKFNENTRFRLSLAFLLAFMLSAEFSVVLQQGKISKHEWYMNEHAENNISVLIRIL